MRGPGRLLAVLFVFFVAGCSLAPSERNRELLTLAVDGAGLPADVEGFAVTEASLRPAALAFHYVRPEPPGAFHVLRFAESAHEQNPRELRSLEQLLETVGAGKEAFRVVEETLMPEKTLSGTGALSSSL